MARKTKGWTRAKRIKAAKKAALLTSIIVGNQKIQKGKAQAIKSVKDIKIISES